ncbi:hypothetical protein Gotri_006165 [Gossypium trilobum]|uniref:Uncharacterized protein n=1 Tax=Gossypium trilobum TaxID=34281 RepID=A0A7J9EZ20_9ROSI|nr:hypothetical protein [Gossypium trilobum]
MSTLGKASGFWSWNCTEDSVLYVVMGNIWKALETNFFIQTQTVCFIDPQLQLQRNEVIALMNLLNRLSESVKFVHEMGAAAEMGRMHYSSRLKSLVQRVLASIVKT